MRRLLPLATGAAAFAIASLSFSHWYAILPIADPVSITDSPVSSPISTETLWYCVDSSGQIDDGPWFTSTSGEEPCGTLVANDGVTRYLEEREIITSSTTQTTRTQMFEVRGSTELRVTDADAQMILIGGATNVDPPAPPEEFSGIHDITGFPIDSDGWTDVTAMLTGADYVNSEFIYVCPSAPNDSGAAYTQAQVGSNPRTFTPTAEDVWQTLSSAYGQWTDNEADVVLLCKGGDWSAENWPRFDKDGASASAPFIVTSYGTGARPITGVLTNGASTNPPSNYVAVIGLQPQGVDWNAGFDVFLLEDFSVNERPDDDAVTASNQNVAAPQMSRFWIRRGQIYRNSASTIALGMYVQLNEFNANSGNMLLEEVVLDHNGWDVEADRDIFQHNVYLADENDGTDFVVRGIITARASSHGLHQRPGGIQLNNLSLANPHFQFGYDASGPFTGTSSYNVMLYGDNISDTATQRGTALELADTQNTVVHHNLIAHSEFGNRVFGFNIQDGIDTLTIRDNVIYNWHNNGPGSGGSEAAIRIEVGSPTALVITDNIIQNPDGGLIWQFINGGIPVPAQTTLDGNIYFSSDGTSSFTSGTGFGDNSYATWVSEMGETNSSYSDITGSFTDPTRDLVAYMTALDALGVSTTGIPANTEEALEDFLSQARSTLTQGNLDNKYFRASAFNQWIREGFDIPETELTWPYQIPTISANDDQFDLFEAPLAMAA